MTRHNLREHLTWLLTSKTCNPPSPGHTPPVTSSIPSTQPGEEQLSHLRCPNLEKQAGAQPGILGGYVDDTKAVPEHVHPTLPAGGGFSESTKMTRLRSDPPPGKRPRLLSQMSPDPLQTSTPSASKSERTWLKDQYNSHYKGIVESMKSLAFSVCHHS